MRQFQTLADFQILLRRVVLEAFDMLALALDVSGEIGIVFLRVLNLRLFIEQRMNAARATQRD